ncbi:uncharacterized protein BO96DRAFT_436099 [Aspergillus niger CBS 101883]|uniref:uncharacterized protein n=1 Tax=Aspergillus lacticoffeatus (strain CBS 101883) TaxID=1450533 RepID=UPI000D801C49|nr:uncharacterized protein BO96DRAFT_436099 [Aspergillus niger CBS 101883]PYH54477.1 hypothetical protein BO96DRAFT_436099 [Aspergillus niger CBS 101883]
MGLTLTGAYNTRQLQIVIINSILVVLSILAVVLRIWARRLQGLSLFIEDYLSIIALSNEGLHAGVGEHVDTLSAATLFWNTCLPVIKLSIVLFYQRIFPVPSMIFACRSIMLFLAVWYIAFQTTAIFQCIPIHHEWQKKTTKGHCIDFVPFVTTLAATNLCTDVLLLVLPTREIWKLQIPWARKIGLSIIFTLGVIELTICNGSVCAISIVRLGNLIAISDSDITSTISIACQLLCAILIQFGLGQKSAAQRKILQSPTGWVIFLPQLRATAIRAVKAVKSGYLGSEPDKTSVRKWSRPVSVASRLSLSVHLVARPAVRSLPGLVMRGSNFEHANYFALNFYVGKLPVEDKQRWEMPLMQSPARMALSGVAISYPRSRNESGNFPLPTSVVALTRTYHRSSQQALGSPWQAWGTAAERGSPTRCA